MRRAGMRWGWMLGALGLLGGVTAPSVAAGQTLRVGVSESFRGGVTVDGWSAVSTPTTLVSGEFRLQMPRRAQTSWSASISAGG